MLSFCYPIYTGSVYDFDFQIIETSVRNFSVCILAGCCFTIIKITLDLTKLCPIFMKFGHFYFKVYGII